MTLDYADDLSFFKKVFESFDTGYFSLRDIVKLIDQYPEIKEINFYLQEEWKKNQDSKISLSLN